MNNADLKNRIVELEATCRSYDINMGLSMKRVEELETMRLEYLNAEGLLFKKIDELESQLAEIAEHLILCEESGQVPMADKLQAILNREE